MIIFRFEYLFVTLLGALLLLLGAGCADLMAAPFKPAKTTAVLEKLPGHAANWDAELVSLRAVAQANPSNVGAAVALARGYLALGRQQADPRYYGYAEAALGPWIKQPQPPMEVLLLRATLRQNRHQFDAALKDLDTIIQTQPGNAQAWLTRAVVLQVRGEYEGARRSCDALQTRASWLIYVACTSHVGSLTGRGEEAYRLLASTIETTPASSAPVQQWALTLLAEMAARLGRVGGAEKYFKLALANDRHQPYLLAAYADFLLDNQRSGEVIEFLKDETRADALLLRLALAELKQGHRDAADHIQSLQARFAAAQRRGDSVHLREEARFTLEILQQPQRALALAQENWRVQREPADARVLMAAALALDDAAAAEPVVEWIDHHGLEDVRLRALRERLEAS
jgi:tetratricopeptide (TPR) repeat protein